MKVLNVLGPVVSVVRFQHPPHFIPSTNLQHLPDFFFSLEFAENSLQSVENGQEFMVSQNSLTCPFMARELLWLVPRQLGTDLLVKLQLPKAIDVLLTEKLVAEGQGHVVFQGFSAFALQPSYRLGN